MRNRMQKMAILILFSGTAPPAMAKQPVSAPSVTVAQLEQFLSAAHELRDKKLAAQIYDLRLTQQLSDSNLARLEKELPGPESEKALVAIADESVFLKLPAEDIPPRPAPSPTEQAAILARAMDYLTRTVHALPDFNATRTTTTYVGTTKTIPSGAYDVLFGFWGLHKDQRLVPALKSSVAVLYRDGQDTYADEEERVKQECKSSGPIAWVSTGQFGAVLAVMPKIVTSGGLIWDHWEKNASGYEAAFRYSAVLPYQDEVNCPSEMRTPKGPYEYHGEIAIRPEDGTVLRITRVWNAMLDEHLGYGPARYEFEVMVQYGPIEIGHVAYTCPIRSVLVDLGPALEAFPWTRLPKEREDFDRRFGLAEEPTTEGVDDVVFQQYRVFRGRMKIEPGFNTVPGPDQPVSVPRPGNQPVAPR